MIRRMVGTRAGIEKASGRQGPHGDLRAQGSIDLRYCLPEAGMRRVSRRYRLSTNFEVLP